MSKTRKQPLPPPATTSTTADNRFVNVIRAHKVVAALVGLAVGIVAVLGGLYTMKVWPFDSPSPRELAAKYDGTNPSDECAGEGKTVTTLDAQKLYTASGEEVGLAELRHAQECDTNWLRVTTSLETGTVVKTVRREGTEQVPSGEVTTDDITGVGAGPSYESFSEQLYADGCFEIEVQIFDESGALYSELKPTSIC